MPVFLAVLNMEAEQAGADRAQSRARAHGAAARCALLLGRRSQRSRSSRHRERLSTRAVPQEAGHATPRRPSASSRWRGGSPARCSARPARSSRAARPARLCKADLATDMVREMTELQGTMGGIYAREDGQPEAVWKAIYYHYLPVGVEADAPPTRTQLGAAAVAVGGRVARRQARHGRRHVRRRRAADRLARSVRPAPRGAGHRPHARRPARADRRSTSSSRSGAAGRARAGAASGGRRPGRGASRRSDAFLLERVRYVLEQRGADVRNVRAVTGAGALQAIARSRRGAGSTCCPSSPTPPTSRSSPRLFKRVRNIARNLDAARVRSRRAQRRAARAA